MILAVMHTAKHHLLPYLPFQDTSTNKSSPLVQAVGTVERLGVLVASSENTRSNATYKRDNLSTW